MDYLLKFTEQERRLVLTKYADYIQTLQIIAELHGVAGPVVVAPDGSGLLRVPNAQAPAAQKG